MSHDTLNATYQSSLSSIQEERNRAAAASFVAGAAVLALGSDGFLKWGKRAEAFCLMFAMILPNTLIMKYLLGWF